METPYGYPHLLIRRLQVRVTSRGQCGHLHLFRRCQHLLVKTIFSLAHHKIQNYVGLNSSLRIRRSKSLAFFDRPTISIILTLRSCDIRRQIMVIPHTFSSSRGNRVRWHAKTNYGHSAPFHPGSIVSDGTQRQIMVILCLSIQARSCPMARRDKLWSFCTFVFQRRRAR